MPFTNTDTNMTTSTGLTPGMQTYYNRELLKTMQPKLVHQQFGTKYPMPLNNGTVMNLRKILPLDADTTPLVEGNPGDAIMLSEIEVTMNLKQYGRYARFTDLLDLAHMDLNLSRRIKTLADQGALSMDQLVCDELATCTNVIYAGGKTSRAELGTTDKLTTVELRKAVRTLDKALAQRFDGYYVAIINPDIHYDLQDDPTFIEVSKYQDKENIYSGEIGRLFGVRLVETTQAKVFKGAGAEGADVASVIVLGRDAYGLTDWKGANPRVIVKSVGSAGTADPLDQISTVGWKMDGFGVKLLQPEYAVRIECGFTDGVAV